MGKPPFKGGRTRLRNSGMPNYNSIKSRILWKMRIFLLTLLLLVHALPAYAILWPTLPDLTITSCGGPSSYPCSLDVYYSPGTVSFVDVPNNVPINDEQTEVYAYGVHCGGGGLGKPFTNCRWYRDTSHRPIQSGKCVRAKSDSWELTADSTCAVNPGIIGDHFGAPAGAECVVFGKAEKIPPFGILTPWGELTAMQVANSGSTYCVKPLPPNTTCELSVPGNGIIDHGTVSPNEVSERTITLTTDCGSSPKLSFMGDNVVSLGTGVTAEITTAYLGSNLFGLTSTLRTVNAAGGDYRASFIVIVSPN